ncbi:diflavin flavoprotein [Phormidium tenue FACHB-886]|nr:diflavin flavoprotein [Phormidium tenue FACHB-886]
MADAKPRDVQVAEIGADTTVLRSRTWDRLRFEIEYARQKGTTANTYLIQADKTALIDPPGESFTEIFLDELYQHVYLQRINYVILGHINSNRIATLKALLNQEVAPQITFVCTRAAEVALQTAFPQWSLRILVVNSEETIDLGQGHVLQFIPTPTPRYPDGLCTYDQATRILYTDKLFGAHVCDKPVFDDKWKLLDDDRHYYFECIHASQFKQVEATLDKLSPFSAKAKIYAPNHGPMVRYSVSRLTFDYRYWCEQQQIQDLNVALLYASAYGNTSTLGHAIAQGLIRAGASVQTVNCELADPAEITQILQSCDGFIFGTPTLAGHAPTQIQTALGIALSSAARTKLTGVFGSFGWSGEAIDLVYNKLQDAGYRFGFEPIRVKFKPTEDTLHECETAGVEFVQALRKTKKFRAVRQPHVEAQAGRTDQAVGRIAGSLCVVTTHRSGKHQGLLTSWVSQATFNPPGLTVAIPLSQGEATLPTIGSEFVLNILKEGGNVRRHFQKAGSEDGMGSLDTHPAQNGCLILDQALAYLECTVKSRMECGDHWLLYATVENGKVLEAIGMTAVQHRKSGTQY